MINMFVAFIILAIALYLATRVLDMINARFNLLPKPDVIRPQTKTEMAFETFANGLAQGGDFPSIDAHHVTTAGEIDVVAVGSEVVTNAEGLVEGVQALAESAGEALTTIIVEGLTNQ